MSWLPKKSVVVPFDFSEPCHKALETARELVDDAARIHVVHVLHEIRMGDRAMYWETFDKELRAQQVVNALRTQFASGPFEKSDFQVRFGDPGSEIVTFAQEVNAELIVIPSHGRAGIPRLLLGSVAECVLRLSPCPVLIVK